MLNLVSQKYLCVRGGLEGQVQVNGRYCVSESEKNRTSMPVEVAVIQAVSVNEREKH